MTHYFRASEIYKLDEIKNVILIENLKIIQEVAN